MSSIDGYLFFSPPYTFINNPIIKLYLIIPFECAIFPADKYM